MSPMKRRRYDSPFDRTIGALFALLILGGILFWPLIRQGLVAKGWWWR